MFLPLKTAKQSQIARTLECRNTSFVLRNPRVLFFFTNIASLWDEEAFFVSIFVHIPAGGSHFFFNQPAQGQDAKNRLSIVP